MTGRGLLDADMRTLGLGLAQGWAWWVGELRALVPTPMRRAPARRLRTLRFADGKLTAMDRRRGTHVVICVPPDDCLLRTVERPPTTDRDLQRMLAFESDMLLPFAPGASLVAGARLPAGEGGRTLVAVAGLPLAMARALCAEAERLGVRPAQVLIDAAPPTSMIDFAPAMRSAGILPPLRRATPWVWGLVGLLAIANLTAMIHRDMESVDRLNDLVQAQQPALVTARTITYRADRDRALRAHVAALRMRHDALDALAVVSRTLPTAVWLERYAWDGATLRITGYKPPGTDVTTALRRSGRFPDVHALADEGQIPTATGEPFDLTARIAPRGAR